MDNIDGLETVETTGAETTTPDWKKALAFSALRPALTTPEHEEKYLTMLGESLTASLGLEPGKMQEPNVNKLLRLFFLGETFAFTDEDGVDYVWSVTEAKNLLSLDPREPVPFAPKEFGITAEHIFARYPGFDPERAKSADLTVPLIFIAFKGEALLIDGWHRLYRAVTEGIESIPCHVLSQGEAQEILTEPEGETP